jgi:hypothetical protein
MHKAGVDACGLAVLDCLHASVCDQLTCLHCVLDAMCSSVRWRGRSGPGLAGRDATLLVFYWPNMHYQQQKLLQHDCFQSMGHTIKQ